MGKHILLLGGGFGGLAAADTLRRGLSSEHRVTLVGRQPLFLMGLDGPRRVGESLGNRTLLAKRGVDFIEIGDGKAAPVQANFYAQPSPKWEFTPQSEEGYREKPLFLEERMKAWFA